MNETLLQLLNTHLSLYPGMEVQDCIKLLYQNEMGGGHLIEDESAFIKRLNEEINCPGLLTARPSSCDPIGNGLCRVHLSSLDKGPSATTMARLCSRAARQRGSTEQLAVNLQWLKALIENGQLPYSPEEAAEIDDYIAEGCPQPSHSGRFRGLYGPSYRLLDVDAALYLPVFKEIDGFHGSRTHLLVGVDGMSNSGKSTLAQLLVEVYGCGVVHADDFFLQPHQRTPERLAEPGGNIDYERLSPFAQMAGDNRAFEYQAYNCQLGALDSWRTVPGCPITLLEGAYCLHPKIAAPCDVRIFLSVEAETQRQRVIKRNGPEMAVRFENEWIPMEHSYFNEFKIRESCDIAIDTTALGVR